jgi:hypothetical protein
MKKIILLGALAAAISVSAVVSAAPLANPQKGDLKVNANYGFNQKEGSNDAHSRFVGGDITYGINNHWAVQYMNNATRGTTGKDIDEHYFNGIYRVTNYVSAYGGMSYIKTDLPYSNKHAYGYQVGLRGQIPLTDRISGFASVGVGDDANTYLIGAGYAITKDWDAHIQYRKSSIDTDNYNDDVRGWQVGMGYKF